MKVIFHLDLDSYFVSAHRTIDPKLNNKSVVVGKDNNSSIVTSTSYEAKGKGVKVPMPIYKAKKIVPDLIIIEPNFDLYLALSNRLFNFIETKYTNLIEIASIDECYLDVTKIWKKYGSPYKLAKNIQKNIMREMKLPISIGISSTKFIAKMSTQINKPFGITITKKEDFLKVFGSWETNKFFGIGNATAEKLKKLDIHTIFDIANADLGVLKRKFGKNGLFFHDCANGKSTSELNYTRNNLKSIGHELTFKQQSQDIGEVMKILKVLIKRLSSRAEKRNVIGNVISINWKEELNDKITAKRKQRKLSFYTNKYENIVRVVRELLEEIWKEQKIKLIGVSLSNIKNIFETTFQSNIFEKIEEKNKIEKLINSTNQKFKDKVLLTGFEFSKRENKKNKQTKFLESDRGLKYFEEKN